MSAADPHRLGSLLLRFRRVAGLTQAGLAAAAGVSERTVREMEHGRVARPQQTTAVLLADALGLTGAERAQFLAATGHARARVPAPRSELEPTGVVALPPAADLVGRDHEITSLVDLVTGPTTGPVTLVGLAGVGKTALALAVAHRVTARFPGGVAGVTLDEHGEADETLATVCFVFGVADAEELAARLARRPGLLVLDAVDRAPEKVRRLLELLPTGLRVLMTGRAPVRAPGERAIPVCPLPTPPAAAHAPLSEVVAYPAARLFVDRLVRVRGEAPAPDEVPALVELVRRLGGLPLALELAAAHTRLLRLPEILQRYGDRVLDLGGGVESSLRDAVAGSYRLLDPDEQRALRALATFRHRWSLELAEWLLEPAGDPLPLLDRLVGLGLVAVSGAREHRFRLVDVVRDFATEQARELGELPALRRAHARVVTRVAERTAPELAGPRLTAAVARLDDLAADVWAALNHAANDDPPTALRLASHLPRWWRFRGRDAAGRHWLRRLLDDPRTAAAGERTRAWAQVGLAGLSTGHGGGAAERAMVSEALATLRRLGDVAGQLAAGHVLSSLCLAAGEYEAARRYLGDVLTTAAAAGLLREQAVAQSRLTWHDIRTGDLAAARQRLAVVDRLAARLGDTRLRTLAAARAAEVARLAGRHGEAVVIGRRVLERLPERGDPDHRQRVLGTLGRASAALSRFEDAERVLALLRRPDGTASRVEGEAASVEAWLAWGRGDRASAAEWFRAAVAAFEPERDRRDLVESLAGLAGATDDTAERQDALARLAEVTGPGGFTLLPVDRELLSGAENAAQLVEGRQG